MSRIGDGPVAKFLEKHLQEDLKNYFFPKQSKESSEGSFGLTQEEERFIQRKKAERRDLDPQRPVPLPSQTAPAPSLPPEPSYYYQPAPLHRLPMPRPRQDHIPPLPPRRRPVVPLPNPRRWYPDALIVRNESSPERGFTRYPLLRG